MTQKARQTVSDTVHPLFNKFSPLRRYRAAKATQNVYKVFYTKSINFSMSVVAVCTVDVVIILLN